MPEVPSLDFCLEQHVTAQPLSPPGDRYSNFNCASGGLIDPTGDSFMTCSSCDTTWYVTAGQAYRPEITYTEIVEAFQELENASTVTEQRRDDDARAQEYLKGRSNRCPTGAVAY